MRNLIRALRGKPVDLSPKQQEKLAKAQAKADAIIAEREAAGRKAMEDAAAFMATQPGGAKPPSTSSSPTTTARSTRTAAPAGAPTRTRCCTRTSTTSAGSAPCSTPSTDRRRRSSPRSSTCSTELDPLNAFPQIFGRNDRPQLGPYCGPVED